MKDQAHQILLLSFFFFFFLVVIKGTRLKALEKGNFCLCNNAAEFLGLGFIFHRTVVLSLV